MAYSHHRVYSIGNKGKPGKIKDKTICMWLNDDGLPNLVSKQRNESLETVRKDLIKLRIKEVSSCATTF